MLSMLSGAVVPKTDLAARKAKEPLLILTPMVDIDWVHRESSDRDSIASRSAQEYLSTAVVDLLDAKYDAVMANTTKTSRAANNKSWKHLKSMHLGMSPSRLKPIMSDFNLPDSADMVLISGLKGFYNQGVIDRLASQNGVPFPMQAPFESHFWVALIDVPSMTVLFSDCLDKSTVDPRAFSDLELMLKEALKPVYYKKFKKP